MKISKLTKKDINGVALIASRSFSGLKEKNKARKWIECNFKAYPRMQYFIACLPAGRQNKKIVGYVLWLEKGGFRKKSVWEMEQIAVDKNYRGRGIGSVLIDKSFEAIKKYLKKQNRSLKLVEITTGTNNKAQNLYKKTLGAKPECAVKDFFRGDEVIMLARFKKERQID